MHVFSRVTPERAMIVCAVAAIALGGLVGCATLFGGNTADDWGDAETFHKMDHDNDGFLTKEDLRTHLDWFDEYDNDDDGRLSRQEFRDGPAQELGEVGNFPAYDADGNGALTEPEFIDGLFKDLDDNGDGKLNSGEWGL